MKKNKIVITIFAASVIIIILFVLSKEQRKANTSGGYGTIQYMTLGTITEIDLSDGIITVRVHKENEDQDYVYKSILHYFDDDTIDLKFNLSQKCEGFEVGDVIAFNYFSHLSEQRPLPTWHAEVIGKEESAG